MITGGRGAGSYRVLLDRVIEVLGTSARRGAPRSLEQRVAGAKGGGTGLASRYKASVRPAGAGAIRLRDSGRTTDEALSPPAYGDR